jgi:hypothetical protein
LLHKGTMEKPRLLLLPCVLPGKLHFLKWAMLGSNQRPLPCESSTIVCWRFLDCAKLLQIAAFTLLRIS